MGSKRSARRKKNAQLAHVSGARPAPASGPASGPALERGSAAAAADALSDPFFRADSLAPAELDARVASVDAPPDARVGEPRKWSAEARARRARFGRYVAMTVGACAVVCALAGIRHATAARSTAPTAAAKQDVVLRPPPPAPVPLPPVAVDAVEPSSEPPPAERFTESTESDRDVARREKRESQRALELGHVAEAIAHGEKSIAVDPGDRESWLILGAAYQHAGAQEDARRCFQGCLAQGKRGATWECAAMLR